MRYFIDQGTVIGYKHKLNQDRVIAESMDDGKYGWLIVSDGHGSRKRAERGAQFAVDTAKEIVKGFIIAVKNGDISHSVNMSSAIESIKGRILWNWQECVKNDLKKDPFELETSNMGSDEYGATLLIACILDELGVVYLQLGDGDICVTMSDERILTPIEKRIEQVGNLTHSLCEKDAINSFDSLFCRGELPQAIIITTDGVSNAIPNKYDFEAIGQMAITQSKSCFNKAGIADFRSKLTALLERCTMASGDDCSMAFAIDISMIGDLVESKEHKKEK